MTVVGFVVAVLVGRATEAKTSSGFPTEQQALPAAPAIAPVTLGTPPILLSSDDARPSEPPVAAAFPNVDRGVDDPPARSRFVMDLYRLGDFVSQATATWCVPASILTMANVVGDRRAEHMPTQAAVDRMSRSLSSSRLVGAGSEPKGWARTLDRLGFGPYVVGAEWTMVRAIRAAALAIRRTGRPVGLLMWRGAHAWVMTGFEATADPASTTNFRVTTVRVTDPWYPRTSGTWGRTRPPDARVGVDRLARVYLRWRRPTVRYAELDGRFVLVLPVRQP
jgi:hypothetical protein